MSAHSQAAGLALPELRDSKWVSTNGLTRSSSLYPAAQQISPPENVVHLWADLSPVAPESPHGSFLANSTYESFRHLTHLRVPRPCLAGLARQGGDFDF